MTNSLTRQLLAICLCVLGACGPSVESRAGTYAGDGTVAGDCLAGPGTAPATLTVAYAEPNLTVSCSLIPLCGALTAKPNGSGSATIAETNCVQGASTYKLSGTVTFDEKTATASLSISRASPSCQGMLSGTFTRQ